MIHVEGLTKYYDGLCAVDNVSFDISKGEILGLLGPNGAGKTTTLRMLTGFILPSSGNIQVGGYSIRDDRLAIKKILGYLPESAPLYREMLVYDYLGYVATIKGLTAGHKFSRIRELATLCGLNEVMHRPIAELSKGYRQRVGLAHALMNDPEILVLDEPTSGLDPNQIIEIREIVKRIGKKRTIIFSTHILSEAEATCDRIIIINRGKIVADGSAENLKESAQREYKVSVIVQYAEAAVLEAALKPIEGITSVSCAPEAQGLVQATLSCQSAIDVREAVYRKIKETDWTLLELHRESMSLENIFRDITKES